jgi:microcystin-dependent protein
MSPFVAEIRAFPFNFAPRGWAFCNGQLLAIAQNTALFSLLGTNYGGDGKSTFALPNLQGGGLIGTGEAVTGTNYDTGQSVGSDNVTLLPSQIPSHTHTPYARTEVGTADMHNVPVAGDYLTRFNSSATAIGDMWHTAPLTAGTAFSLHTSFVQGGGGDKPHNNMQPVQVLSYCIALQGVYPPHS